MANAVVPIEERILYCLSQCLREVSFWHFKPALRKRNAKRTEFMARLLTPLLQHPCEDFTKVSGNIRTYAKTCSETIVLNKRCGPWSEATRMGPTFYLDALIRRVKNFYHLSVLKIETAGGNPFGYALLSTDRALMETLVQYDMMTKQDFMDEPDLEYYRAAISIFKFGLLFLGTAMIHGWNGDPKLTEFVQKIVDSLCRDPSVRDWTVLLSLFLPVLKWSPGQEEISQAKEYAEVIKIYLRTVDKPYVTARDMEKFLKYFYGEDAPIETAIESFKSIFQPDSCRPSGPKPLLQLCRCTIRKQLQGIPMCTLPTLVRYLEVPETMQEYILGKF